VQWRKPSDDGGAPVKGKLCFMFQVIQFVDPFDLFEFILGYNIERREKDSKKWKKLNKDLIKVRKFLFVFRVSNSNTL